MDAKSPLDKEYSILTPEFEEMEGLIINAFVEFNNILYEAKKAHAKENGLDVKSIVKPTFGLEDYKGKKPKAPKAPKAPKPPKPEKEKKVKEKKK